MDALSPSDIELAGKCARLGSWAQEDTATRDERIPFTLTNWEYQKPGRDQNCRIARFLWPPIEVTHTKEMLFSDKSAFSIITGFITGHMVTRSNLPSELFRLSGGGISAA